jgi:hypothetical protein
MTIYLEIMMWPEPGFEVHAIHGSLADLKRFAAIVENRLAVSQAGDSVCIQDEFAANSSYALVLEVREDDFDPANTDPRCQSEPGE